MAYNDFRQIRQGNQFNIGGGTGYRNFSTNRAGSYTTGGMTAYNPSRSTSTGFPQYGQGGQMQFMQSQPQQQYSGYNQPYSPPPSGGVQNYRQMPSSVAGGFSSGGGVAMTNTTPTNTGYLPYGRSWIDPALFGDSTRPGPRQNDFQRAMTVAGQSLGQGAYSSIVGGTPGSRFGQNSPEQQLARYAALRGIPIERASADLFAQGQDPYALQPWKRPQAQNNSQFRQFGISNHPYGFYTGR